MMIRSFQSIGLYKFAILSGVLVGTSYVPFPPWAVLFCYAPLWIWAQAPERTLKEIFWGGWWTQFILTLIGFHWVAYTAHEFAYMPWPLAVLILLLFAGLMHLYIPLALVLTKKFAGPWFLLAIPFAHSLAERFYPAIFQWNLGYTFFYSQLPIYQWADVIGFEGLSTIALLINAAVAWIYLNRHQTRKALVSVGVLVFVFLGLNLTGQLHGLKWQNTDAELNVMITQANIGNLEKVYAEKGKGYQAAITTKFLELSQQGLLKQKPDLMVWPETAFPDYLDSHLLDRVHARQLVTGLYPMDTPVLTGAYSKDPLAPEETDTNTFNALFLIRPDGISFSPPYRKTHLLAFGEYLPLSEQFPILLKLLPFVSNFGRGQGPTLLSLPHPRTEKITEIGGQICYESLYPYFTRELTNKGAHIIANVTNDSWFGRPFEPLQHLSMTLARGVENRRPVIRSTNTGVSTVMLASGKILEQSPLHQEWTGHYKIPYQQNPEITFYTRWGYLDYLIYIFVLGFIFVKGWFHAKSRNA